MKTIKFTTDEFIAKSILIHNNKYDYSLVDYKNIFIPVIIKCHIHGIFEQIPNSHLRGSGCKHCANEFIKGKKQILSIESFINRSNLKHNNKYDYSLSKYKNTSTKVKIICREHGIFEQIPSKHLAGQGCKECGRKIINVSKLISKDEFINKSKQIHGDKYDYSLLEYKNTSTKVKIGCYIHGVWEQKPSKHLKRQGCRKCSGSNKLTSELFISKSNEVHDCKYDYSLADYKDHYVKVKIICPIHKIFEQGAGSHMSGVGCPRCKESKGEKEIFNQLIKRGIVFEKQKTFEGCKFKNKLRFDFYLPEHKVCIEYDGEQHFKSIPYYGGQEKLDLIQKKDEIKTRFCEDNGIKLIRIRFDEEIKIDL